MKIHSKQPELLSNRSMFPCVVIPELAYSDVRAAVAWLCRTFGFVERLHIGDHRAQLVFGQGCVIATELPRQLDALTSEESQATKATHATMVRVAGVDHHYEQAKACAAQIISPPTDYPYGERQYTVADLGGHWWTCSQSSDDVNPSDWGGTLLEQR